VRVLGTGAGTEVLVGSAGGHATTEKHGVGASGVTQGKLVESDAFAAGSLDAGTHAAGEPQGANLEGRNLLETDIVGDGAHDDADLK